ncbi:AAA family ATPase [Endozoicomonas sp. ALE010]|uniref:AAA family ATPase n=1 Tax=Endozoicomonas sp. ALE010 TaxID=3403081 RepID=UPI003BB803FC
MSLKNRIEKIVQIISKDMHEREEIIAVALLGALSGHNTFLYGPPGTAKSLIARRLSCAFDSSAYFEYLMNRFSTPEEVFGPVSIKELKEDRYVRKTQHYLPTAEFAFLDEIWKSSPAILNTLLTLINEGVFRNGEKTEQVPLKALIAASNETPAASQGLDALYDRFIIRLVVPPIKDTENFERLLNAKPSSASIDVSKEDLIKNDELVTWRDSIHSVNLAPESFTIIHLIREQLANRYEELGVYVSDRRWQRAAGLMKASAFFNGREETNHSDALLLQHCLWADGECRDAVSDIVKNAVRESGFSSGVSLAELDQEKEKLDREIRKELFHSEDVYDAERVGDVFYFKVDVDFKSSGYRSYMDSRTLLIPCSKFKSKDEFHPLDEHGNIDEEVTVSFDNQGSCFLDLDDYDYEKIEFTPNILFHKGDKKKDVNKRLIKSLSESVSDIRSSFSTAKIEVEEKLAVYQQELNSVFSSQDDINVALEGINEQLHSLQIRIKDCERLEALCK